MTTYTTYGDEKNIAGLSGPTTAGGVPRNAVITNDIDFAKRNVTAADVVTALNIPANTFVRSVNVRTLTGESGQTLSVGDGAGTTGWLAAVDVATTGNVYNSALALTAGATPGFVEAVTGYSAGKFYSAADTIDILVPGSKAYTTLKVRISADVVMYG